MNNSFPGAKRFIRKCRIALRQVSLRRASRVDVFRDIYAQGKWGTSGSYFSGTGSYSTTITDPYIASILDFIQCRWPTESPRIVDLGCGDFSIGSRLTDSCIEYTGIDIVPELIERNKANYGNDRVKFVCSDIVTDDLPPANLCLVRQVFQHLSNSDILHILPKLEQYEEILITEHVPSAGLCTSKNRDKQTGAEIRLYWASGIYLDAAPFMVPSDRLTEVIAVPGHPVEPDGDPGLVITTRIRGSRRSNN
jgi:SAM-dependent methyltransferase